DFQIGHARDILTVFFKKSVTSAGASMLCPPSFLSANLWGVAASIADGLRGGRPPVLRFCNGRRRRRCGRQGPPAIDDLHTDNIIHRSCGEGGDGADGNHYDGPGSDDLHPAVSSIGHGGDGPENTKTGCDVGDNVGGGEKERFSKAQYSL
ncbi:MAG: hypothetical protein ACLP51_20495, partial [Syntrophobacteraceae bacterium]